MAGGGMMDFSRVIQMVIEGWGAFFCIIAVVVLRQTKWADADKARGVMQFTVVDGFLLVADVLAIGFRGYPGMVGYYVVRFSNYFVFIFGYLVIISGVAYFGGLIEHRVSVSIRNWKYMEYLVCGLGMAMVTINVVYPFLYDFDSRNQYYRLPWNWLISFTCLLGVVLILVLLLNFFKNMTNLERYAILTALVCPLISLVLQYMHYGISLVIIASCAAVILTFVAHMMDYTAMMVERERRREKWIADEKIRLLHNQIKPHFIYNTLTSIYYGLDEDVDRSKKMLKDLSGYLRGSLDVLDERECIDFRKEMATVECYLNVESFRFENQISVELDIEDDDFKVPAFCIQTLVENSIRHGIRKKDPPEGTISILTRFEDGKHRVEIRDTGTGFDVEQAFDKKGKHIGLRNTRRRLALMCRGSMDVNSAEGEGTIITIVIPGEGK
ncbi:MAG: histidine kinase [Eubacterium sp.]|nr:histidine kinase [Eubacterium sp.]